MSARASNRVLRALSAHLEAMRELGILPAGVYTVADLTIHSGNSSYGYQWRVLTPDGRPLPTLASLALEGACSAGQARDRITAATAVLYGVLHLRRTATPPEPRRAPE